MIKNFEISALIRQFLRKNQTPLKAEVGDFQEAFNVISLALDKGIKVSEQTLEQINQRQKDIAYQVDLESLKSFLIMLLQHQQAAYGLYCLKKTQLLKSVLPDLALNEGIQQGGFHHLDVLDHSFEALRQLLFIFPEASLSLRLATLLHDVGKASCLQLNELGQKSFIGHDKEGALLAGKMLERLGFDDTMIHRVKELIHYHMLSLPKTTKEAKRFAYKRRHLLPDLLQLMIADREAARGALSSARRRKAYQMAMTRVLKVLAAPEEKPEKMLLTGNEVMCFLNIPAGPKVGQALAFLKEASLVGDIHTKEEAKKALRHFAEKQAW